MNSQSSQLQSLSPVQPQAEQRKCVLLLMTPATYRGGAFVQAARRLALDVVIGVDTPPGLATSWPSEVLALDFKAPEEAVERIVSLAHQRPLQAVLSVDDSAVELAALASEALGLPCNAPAAAEAARDKYLMRQRMAAAGVPCPVFRHFPLTADPEAIAHMVGYPCVLKPRRLSGSRGVIRANTPAEFVTAFYRLKRILLSEGFDEQTTGFLVEDFIPGFEVALEGLLTSGRLQVLALFDKPDPLDGPFFEETIYVTPSRLPYAVQEAIRNCVELAAAAIGLREGPAHAELRVNEQGPWMLEIAGRSIGGLCSTILEFGAGMCLEELILRHALGLELPSLERRPEAAGVMMIPIPRAGILKGVYGVEDARQVPLITGVEITAPLNNRLVPLPEGASYLGFIFARGDSPAAVEEALRTAHRCLRFDIRRDLPVLNAGPLPSTPPLGHT
ncbi:ATP-grasp domain-containing protein [Thermogemmatispora sp.]|uniref:ATP-grasp domain-containing protein n=1 Tax=Thermogemmatispora sp. TaxID=1968838 RepID=UPI001D65A08B|nr:ATP-grasp domain-containing protein [Thermogemmatispora sp.]MBX5451471.1 ATP-grasp domain-containing protein [Thermogemmatispora sp.]